MNAPIYAPSDLRAGCATLLQRISLLVEENYGSCAKGEMFYVISYVCSLFIVRKFTVTLHSRGCRVSGTVSRYVVSMWGLWTGGMLFPLHRTAEG